MLYILRQLNTVLIIYSFYKTTRSIKVPQGGIEWDTELYRNLLLFLVPIPLVLKKLKTILNSSIWFLTSLRLLIYGTPELTNLLPFLPAAFPSSCIVSLSSDLPLTNSCPSTMVPGLARGRHLSFTYLSSSLKTSILFFHQCILGNT